MQHNADYENKTIASRVLLHLKTHARAHTRTRARTDRHAHARKHTHTHTHTHTRTHTHTTTGKTYRAAMTHPNGHWLLGSFSDTE